MESNRPKVVKWFKVYCWVLAVLYAFVILFSIPFFIMSVNPEFMTPESEEEMPPVVALLMGILVSGMGLMLLVMSLMGVFLRPRPWVWIFSLVMICFGMTSACFLPACIPMLLFWIKQDVKDYYGKTKPELMIDQ